MIQLDLKSGVPICDQIVNGFIRLKALGVMSADDQMPSVRSLAIKLSVNPNTIQKAYGILETKGIIYTVKGKGSFISGDETAQQAVILKAQQTVEDALLKAKELGLSKEEVLKIVKEVF